MADVRITIADLNYDIRCGDGEEARLMALAAMVDAKARASAGGTETRNLLFASLLLADEVADLQARLAVVEEESAALKAETEAAVATRDAATARAEQAAAALGEAEARLAEAEAAPGPSDAAKDHAPVLAAIARRIELLADRMDTAP